PRPGREQTRLALPARTLAEPTHDLAASGIASVGARVRLLARPGSRALSAPGRARDRLLGPAGAALSLRRRRGGGAADWSGGRGHAGRRRRRGSRRLGGRGVSGARCGYLRRGSRGLLRGRDPALPPGVAHRTVALAESGCRVDGAKLASRVPAPRPEAEDHARHDSQEHPRIAVARMIHTSDWCVAPRTQLTFTLPVLATMRAIRIASSATRAPAQA